jgi:hypothetical protein
MNKDKDNSTTIDRVVGADAISEIAIAIGTEHGVVVSERVWDIGEDFAHEYAHRLDLSTATKSVRLYFSDSDLTTSGNNSRKERVKDRLYRAIAQLVVRTPSPMYAYR